MVDSSEQFRNIPAIRKMLADPMKTSRDMEDFYAQLTKKLNEVPASNSLSISNNNFSEMISDAISSNQRDYEIM